MEKTLQSFLDYERISFLDGFPSYNKVLVHPNDRLKTTFKTKWGTDA
jgi:hypothetical protein